MLVHVLLVGLQLVVLQLLQIPLYLPTAAYSARAAGAAIAASSSDASASAQIIAVTAAYAAAS